jgi:hypothetical protein
MAVDRYTDTIVEVLRPLNARTLLEPGTGDTTTLQTVASRLDFPPGTPILGYDISWSRVNIGRTYLSAKGITANLFVRELEAIPLRDDAADVVFTSHAVEPNSGRETEILKELYRVAGRYLVLFEPSYELASSEARARMDQHGYCRGLRDTAESHGWKVIAHHLVDCPVNPLNPTAVLLIEKRAVQSDAVTPEFHCASCRDPLILAKGAYYCAAEGLAYPSLDEIPCLARYNAILATRFIDDREKSQ